MDLLTVAQRTVVCQRLFEDRTSKQAHHTTQGQAAAAMALEHVIPQVQQELGALIKKPKLSTKLLSKPPFRFLHDIFFAVMRATGFGEGLYEEHELNGKVCMHTQCNQQPCLSAVYV